MKEFLGEGKYLRLVRRKNWEFVERHNLTGIVAVVGTTRKQELVLVEQYREPVQARVIELPAGLAGDTGGAESFETAARRELEEETGYTATRLTELGAFPASPGAISEVVTFFRAKSLKKVGAGGGDASEDIVVHLVPVDEVDRWLKRKAKAGHLIDQKVWAGLYFV
ncbi:MAG: NUDIX hydrolase [Planctomycetota bacterium]|nr:NUDIX hydrolase [Planctomycetota bacterium]